jgi:hypothetical protein
VRADASLFRREIHLPLKGAKNSCVGN